MSRPRTCPNCLTVFGVEEGFHFGPKLVMICDVCSKPIYPVDYLQEQDIDAALRARTSSTWKGWDYEHQQQRGTPVGPQPQHGAIKRYPPLPIADQRHAYRHYHHPHADIMD